MARLTEEQINEIHTLRSKSVSYRKIATTMGIPLDTVKSHCRRHRIMPIHNMGVDGYNMKECLQSVKTQKHAKPVQTEPICEVTVSYAPQDSDALPFLLETLTSVFSGR